MAYKYNATTHVDCEGIDQEANPLYITGVQLIIPPMLLIHQKSRIRFENMKFGTQKRKGMHASQAIVNIH